MDTTTDYDYEGKTNDELSGLLADRGLPTSGNKAELIQRLQDDDAAKAAEADPQTPDPVDDDEADVDQDDDDEVEVEASGRPDGDAVIATTAENGEPDNRAPNPLPADAATGDIVSQVRRGEVDGHTITDFTDVPQTKPGDVLVSVDPFVTIAKGEAVSELRDNAGARNKPQLR